MNRAEGAEAVYNPSARCDRSTVEASGLVDISRLVGIARLGGKDAPLCMPLFERLHNPCRSDSRSPADFADGLLGLIVFATWREMTLTTGWLERNDPCAGTSSSQPTKHSGSASPVMQTNSAGTGLTLG